MNWRTFLREAFSENGSPSSSRLLSAWLSVCSMALIWWYVRHALQLPMEKQQVWLGALPQVIVALATFAVSPYGVAKVTGMGIFGGKKEAPKDIQ